MSVITTGYFHVLNEEYNRWSEVYEDKGCDSREAFESLFELIGMILSGYSMVFCTVNAFGVQRTAQLPVMDHRNKAIANPDSFQVNTAMQRCLAKAFINAFLKDEVNRFNLMKADDK